MVGNVTVTTVAGDTVTKEDHMRGSHVLRRDTEHPLQELFHIIYWVPEETPGNIENWELNCFRKDLLLQELN